MPNETKTERERRITKATYELANKLVGGPELELEAAMNIRFGKKLADRLRATGFKLPEELLLAEAKLLNDLSPSERAQVRRYQNRYSPKRTGGGPTRVKGRELKRLRTAFAANRNTDVVEHPSAVLFTPSQFLVLEGDGTALLFER